MQEDTRKKIIYRVSINTLIVNFVLTVIKFLAGFLGHSVAMISDAIHSASDVLSTIVVMIGAKLSSKKADEKHPYGHEKFECIAAIILALMLLMTALTIFNYGIKLIVNILNGKVVVPSIMAAAAAIFSIVIKEWMYRYTRKAATDIDSTSLLADAWHHRSDALSSVGSFLGIVGAIFGFSILDPIASLVICVIIFKVAIDIMKTALSQVIDTAAPPEIQLEIRNIIEQYEHVRNIDMLKSRLFGNRIYVDIEVQIDNDLSFKEVHDLIHRLHDEIEKSNSSIKHCMIHANPTP